MTSESDTQVEHIEQDSWSSERSECGQTAWSAGVEEDEEDKDGEEDEEAETGAVVGGGSELGRS